MKKAKSIAVYLICTDGKQAGKVILQQRAPETTESGLKKKQSNAYIYQSTWNGGVEGSEKLIEAVKREAIEELGRKFADTFQFQLNRIDTHRFIWKDQEISCYSFIGLVSQKQIKAIKLHSGAVKLIFVNSKDLLNINPQSLGKDPKNHIVLFDDQYRALRKIFSLKNKLVCLK